MTDIEFWQQFRRHLLALASLAESRIKDEQPPSPSEARPVSRRR